MSVVNISNSKILSCKNWTVCLFVGCLMSKHHASVSQGQICTDNFTCCHTEIEFADQTFYLTQSQYIDTRPTSPSTDPIMQGAWQGIHWSANFEVTGMTQPRKIPSQAGFKPRIFRFLGQRGSPKLNRKWSNSGLNIQQFCFLVFCFFLLPT